MQKGAPFLAKGETLYFNIKTIEIYEDEDD